VYPDPVDITDKELDLYIIYYRIEFGITISREEAYKNASSLIRLVKALLDLD
jgi:hypothetical protein